MKRFVSIALVTVAVATTLLGCFKEVIGYTYYNIAVYERTEQNGEVSRAGDDIFAYAYYVDTTEWRIASWEDAETCRITNKTTGEVKDIPDEIGEYTSGEKFPMSIFLDKRTVMLVLVDPTLRMYAYRKYTRPENLAKVDTKLYLESWKRAHTAAGWQIRNPFFGVIENNDNSQTNE